MAGWRSRSAVGTAPLRRLPSRAVRMATIVFGLAALAPGRLEAQIPHPLVSAGQVTEVTGEAPRPGRWSGGGSPLHVDTLAIRAASPWTGVGPGPIVAGPASLDLAVAHAVRRSGVQDSRFIRITADVAGFAAIPGTAVLAGVLYGIGELRDRPDLSDVGLHTGEALAVAAGATLIGKVAAGRARPFVSPEDPGDFRFLRGVSGDEYQAFPSFHTAAAFAAATAIATDPHTRATPAREWIVPLGYTTALLSGVSRIYQDKHWTTDVVVGALVGTFSGLVVSQSVN